MLRRNIGILRGVAGKFHVSEIVHAFDNVNST